MYLHSDKNEKFECLVLSLVIHILLLFLLSLSYEELPFIKKEKTFHTFDINTFEPMPPNDLANKPTEELNNYPNEQLAPLIEAPCILYSPGNSDTPSSTNTIPPSLEKIKASLEGILENEESTIPNNFPDIASTSESKENSSNLLSCDTFPDVPHTTSLPSKKNNEPVSDTLSETGSTIASHVTPSQINSPTILNTKINSKIQVDEPLESIKVPDAPVFKMSTTSKNSLPSSSTPSKQGTRKLTLTDLFKDLSQAPLSQALHKDMQEGKGGAPAVIVQGDIRYHSFITALLEHINSVFHYRQGSDFARNLYRQGKIKHNVTISITLEKSGNVKEARILQSSGSHEFDTFIQETAYQSSPFAPLPDHFKREVVRVELVSVL